MAKRRVPGGRPPGPSKPAERNRSRLSSGPVPSFDDDGPDTNVDDRPEVPLSPLDADRTDTAVDEAPISDPTTRRPPTIRRAPVREKNSVRPVDPKRTPKPAAAVPTPNKPSAGRKLRLPLPPGAGGAKPQAKPTPADDELGRSKPRVTPPLTVGAGDPTRSEVRRKPVPTYSGPTRRPKWPFVLAAMVVAVIGVGFIVASETIDPDAEANRARAGQRVRGPDGRYVAGHPGAHSELTEEALAAALRQQKRLREGPKARPPIVPVKLQPQRRITDFLTDMPHGVDVDDRGENEPKYDEVPASQPSPMLEVVIKPVGAHVYLDDVFLGGAPILVALEPERTTGSLRIENVGYQSKNLSLSVDGVRTYTFVEELALDPGHAARLKAARAFAKTLPPEK